jgi:iron complex outermembrane receptor protein
VGQPHDAISLTFDHRVGPFGANLHVQRYGAVGFRAVATNPALDQTFSAKWITDLSASWNFMNRLEASIGSNNLFDVYPDKVIQANSNSGIFQYSNVANTFGFNGRFVYVKARYTL